MNSAETIKTVLSTLGLTIALTTPLLGQSPDPVRPGAALDLPTEAMTVLRDIEYTRSGQKLDLYLPANAQERLPVILWIHGGAWHSGSKTFCPAVLMVPRGYAAVSINYRLSSDAKFPAQIEDCKAAVRWIRANAEKHRLDPDRIGAMGFSAGGHLAALLGCSADVPELEGKGGNAEFSSRVQAVMAASSPTDLIRLDNGAANNPITQLLGGRVARKKALAAAANPITYASAEDPPFLIMHGERDPIVPAEQSRLLYDALRDVNVTATYYEVAGAGHGFFSAAIAQTIFKFFDEHLTSAPPATQPAE